MKEREASALTAAMLCISIAFLRMLAPSLPFDWMTLVLVLAAAAVIVMPIGRIRRAKPAPEQAQAVSAKGVCLPPQEMDALNDRMDKAGWIAGHGELFDALSSLHESKPFPALCAARGALEMLIKQSRLSEESNATLFLLTSALDSVAGAGEAAVEPDTVNTLFPYALRALGYLETMH